MGDTFARYKWSKEASDAMNPDKAIRELNECIAKLNDAIAHREAMIDLHKSEIGGYPPLAKALTQDRIRSLIEENIVDNDCIVMFKKQIENLQ